VKDIIVEEMNIGVAGRRKYVASRLLAQAAFGSEIHLRVYLGW